MQTLHFATTGFCLSNIFEQFVRCEVAFIRKSSAFKTFCYDVVEIEKREKLRLFLLYMFCSE